MIPNIGKTAIYGRISTESQEDGMSLESQKQACLEFAEKNGKMLLCKRKHSFHTQELKLLYYIYCT